MAVKAYLGVWGWWGLGTGVLKHGGGGREWEVRVF